MRVRIQWMVRVRTAPSPTGIPHIGNTWSALFNFLFARKKGGKFILRLEDTDRARFVQESVDKIYKTLHWLGLEYDEGPDIGGPFAPYVQSERLDLYKKYADQLQEASHSYSENGAIKFKVPKRGATGWIDLIGNKKIEFKNSTQKDFVILKSDGFPTYHLANVVDDYLMEISHVIRGGEWISSTPKHIMLYQAFGWSQPQFAHLPLLLVPDKSKLSKRHGAKSVLEFCEDGYLKEALINFMALLGWSPPSGREILTLEQMIEEFDLKDVNLASPVFDAQKLSWMNGEYIRMMGNQELTDRISEFIGKKYPGDVVSQTLPFVKERIKTLKEYQELAGFFFEEPKIDSRLFGDLAIRHLGVALEIIENEDWEVEKLQGALIEVIEKNKFQTGDFFMDLRVAITGSRVTPPIVESILVLGKEKTKKRITKALELLS